MTFDWDAISAFIRTYDKEIDAASVVVIAAFTVVLGLSTISLWRATSRAAHAAKNAADFIPIVERAYVYPRIVTENIFDMIREIQSGREPSSYVPRVELQFKNYGKTAAFPTSMHALLTCWTGTPVASDTDDWHISYDLALEPNGETETFAVALRTLFTKIEADLVASGQGETRLSGWVTFKDVWGEERTQHFTWKWNHAKRRFVGHMPETHKHSA